MMTAATITTGTIVAALTLAGQWKMLGKMGEKGWKALIPFYGQYLIFKHTWSKKAFLAFIAASVAGGLAGAVVQTAVTLGAGSALILAASVIALLGCAATAGIGIASYHKISKAFGHGIGYTLGMVFAEPIFDMILGFGKSEFAAA